MNSEEELVVLTVFDNGFEANLFKQKLASEEIDSIVFDENMMTLNPLLNLTIGGIRLKVRKADYEKALAVFNEVNATPVTNENEEIIRCPNCHSTRIKTGFKTVESTKSIFAMIISLLTFTTPLHNETVYYCLNCDTKFE